MGVDWAGMWVIPWLEGCLFCLIEADVESVDRSVEVLE